MQQYRIKDKVYIIDGAAKSCVYDCKESRTFWIDHDTSSFFRRVSLKQLEDEDEPLAQSAAQLGLIEEDPSPAPRPWPDIREQFEKPRHIDFAWIELTNKCNLRCTHCYNETLARNKVQMSYDDFVHVVDELKRYGIKEVQLIGGEPFILKEKELFKILSYASESFPEFEVFFNGTLTSRRQLEYIKGHFPNCKIALSLHSFIREEHEKITQVRGSYDKTVETLHALQELGMPFRYVGIYANGIEVGNELDFGVPYKRDYIRLSGKGSLSHYNKELLEEKVITSERLKFKDLTAALQSVYSESCFANYLYIGSDLNVYPCVMERRIKHGSFKHKSLSEVIDKQIVNMSKDEVEGCKDCEFRYLCKDCRPDSLNMGLQDKPWYCSYDVYSGEWIDKDRFVNDLLKLKASADECISAPKR